MNPRKWLSVLLATGVTLALTSINALAWRSGPAQFHGGFTPRPAMGGAWRGPQQFHGGFTPRPAMGGAWRPGPQQFHQGFMQRQPWGRANGWQGQQRQPWGRAYGWQGQRPPMYQHMQQFRGPYGYRQPYRPGFAHRPPPWIGRNPRFLNGQSSNHGYSQPGYRGSRGYNNGSNPYYHGPQGYQGTGYHGQPFPGSGYPGNHSYQGGPGWNSYQHQPGYQGGPTSPTSSTPINYPGGSTYPSSGYHGGQPYQGSGYQGGQSNWNQHHNSPSTPASQSQL